jgi:hypothetical protein
MHDSYLQYSTFIVVEYFVRDDQIKLSLTTEAEYHHNSITLIRYSIF